MAYKDLKGTIYQGPHDAPQRPTGESMDGDGCLEDFVNLVGNEITVGCMIPMNVPKAQVKRMVKQAKKWFYKNYEDSVRENFYYLPKSNFKTELNAVAIEESRKQSGLAAKAQDSRLQLASTKSAAKAARNSAYLKAATTAAIGIQGLKAPTGGSELAGNASAVSNTNKISTFIANNPYKG